MVGAGVRGSGSPAIGPGDAARIAYAEGLETDTVGGPAELLLWEMRGDRAAGASWAGLHRPQHPGVPRVPVPVERRHLGGVGPLAELLALTSRAPTPACARERARS